MFRAALRGSLALALALAAVACPTRSDVVTDDAGVDPGPGIDPSVPLVRITGTQPTCAPESVVDLDVHGLRRGNTLRVRVDTRGRSNELHPSCRSGGDSVEVALRHRVRPGVAALRVTTAGPATEFDTVLYVRGACSQDNSDISCNDDDHAHGPRSLLWVTDTEPGEVLFFVIDGVGGQRGVAELTLTELTPGREGTACRRAPDDTPDGLRHLSRCDPPLRCAPGAASDGTGLCLVVVPTGSACDADERRNLCGEGSACAVDPMDRTYARCAVPGTSPGAPCRSGEPRCAPGLGCAARTSPEERERCVRRLVRGADCDLEGHANLCTPPDRCRSIDPDAGVARCAPTGP